MDFYKTQKHLSLFAIILIVCWLFLLDYNDFSWTKNGSAYLGIASMICLFVSQKLIEKKRKRNKFRVSERIL